MITSKDGKKQVTAEQLDEMFDNGEDVSEFFDMEHPRYVPGDPDGVFTVTLTKKISLELPMDMVDKIDLQASRSGSTRQGMLRQWIWERLRKEEELDKMLGVPPVRLSTYVNRGDGKPVPLTELRDTDE